MQTHVYWNYLVGFYLFLAGGGAGAIFISSFYVLSGKSKQKNNHLLAKITCMWGLIALVVGIFMIVLDLSTLRGGLAKGDLSLIFRFHKLFMTFVPNSIMSWGTWILFLSVPLGILFLLTFYGKMDKFHKTLAQINMLFAIFISSYTAFLLGDVSSNLIWSNSSLVVLFIASALSSGVGIFVLVKTFTCKQQHLTENINFSKIDNAILSFEFICILIFVYTSYVVLSHNFLKFSFSLFEKSGQYMWIGAVFVGIILPFLLNLCVIKSKKTLPHFYEILLATCLLVGAFCLRYSVLIA